MTVNYIFFFEYFYHESCIIQIHLNNFDCLFLNLHFLNILLFQKIQIFFWGTSFTDYF